MDKQQVVNHVRQALNDMILQKGDIKLAMMLPNDSQTPDGNYTLFLSAAWLDNTSAKESLNYIIKVILNHLEEEEKSFVSRISVIKTDDKSLDFIHKAITVRDNSCMTLENVTIFGISVNHAIIFES